MSPPGRRISSHPHGTIDASFGFIGHRCFTHSSGWAPANGVDRCVRWPACGAQGRVVFRGFTLTSDKEAPEKPKKGTAAQSKNRDMGSALRSVYQKTVEETVPDDLLSLLGKLD